MKIIYLIFPLLNLITSCADVLYMEAASIEDTSIVGYWFACEFGYSDPDCSMLDDDGLEFTKDGKVYYIQEKTQMSDAECNGSPCFDSSTDTLIVERVFFVGSYTYSNSSIFLSASLSNSCEERIIWNDDISFFIENVCLGSEEPYMKKYFGVIVVS